jgi:hypothetical protein
VNLHLILEQLLNKKESDIDNIEIIRINFNNPIGWENKQDNRTDTEKNQMTFNLEDLTEIEDPPF